MVGKAFERLVDLMATLRSEKGCPWDREQTHESLRPYLIEESYEVLEAIDHKDYQALKEELGDLLLQVIFHAQIAKEEGRFDIKEVIEIITEKLLRRHPHVFGEDVEIKTAQEQVRNWERLKRSEGRRSVLEGVPPTLSALLRAHRIQEKASTVGFDWDNAEQVWEKVQEEMGELWEAIGSGDSSRIEGEFGDVLFSLVNLSRFIGVNPEDALRHTVDKFIQRFQKVEEELKAQGKSPEASSLEEMDAIWERIKKSP